jgi:nucleotide-binding universal stress UspA family protein
MINIKSVLARLCGTLESYERVNQLLLFPGRNSATSSQASTLTESAIVVAYNGSPNSQAALDLAFCVAHQMRLATYQPVVIHVVYVVPCALTSASSQLSLSHLEQVDRVLWQARYLAEEWRGSFNTHLRFGDVATEITSFVQAENTALLIMGCREVNHPLVQALISKLSCPLVGIPTSLDWCADIVSFSPDASQTVPV